MGKKKQHFSLSVWSCSLITTFVGKTQCILGGALFLSLYLEYGITHFLCVVY